MEWLPLLDCKEKQFPRSIVFRFPAEYPFEDIVDFMLIEDFDAPIKLKLICSTGYHAGQTELIFPEEAAHPSGGLSVEWVVSNWKKWIYPNCDIQDVVYIEQYPSGV